MDPIIVAVKLKLADVVFTEPEGPAVIVVSGARVSTVHDRLAGVASMFPAASAARTWNVCEPFARFV